MAFKKAIIDYNGKLKELANTDYLIASSLGSNTPTIDKVLVGDSSWVDFSTLLTNNIALANYWTLTGSDVYRATGNVFIGSASSYGAYKLQVTGDSYFVGGIMSSQGGTAALPKITLSGSTTTGIYTPAANSWGVSTNSVNALVVNASQFLGINNTNPLTRLHVTDSNAYQIRIERTGSATGLIGISGQTANSTGDMLFDMTAASQGFVFRTRNASNTLLNAFGITRNGDIGIGTFAPLLSVDIRKVTQYARPSIGGVSTDGTRWGYSLNPIDAGTSYDIVRSSNIGFRISRETALGGGTFTTEFSINTSGYIGIGINTITSSTGAYHLQVGGDIYGSTLTGTDTLLKTVGGVITRAIDGTDYYSPATIASANYWTLLSGNVYRASGNVGIGISTPISEFHVSSVAPIYSVTATNLASGLRINILGQPTNTLAYRLQSAGVTVQAISTDGNLGVGGTYLSYANIAIQKDITGASTAYGLYVYGTVKSDVTVEGFGIRNLFTTAASTFTLNNYYHFAATQGTIGAGSVVSTQIGFLVTSTMTGATTNLGFRSMLSAAPGRWNFFIDGTAQNHFMGDTLFGGTITAGSYKLQVFGQSYFRNLTTNAEIARFVDVTDGSYLAIHNWGLSVNRSASYLRPSTNNDKTFYLGDSVNSLKFNTLSVGATNITFPEHLDFKLLKTSTTGVLQQATGADVAALLGTAASGNYILNQNSSAQSANFWISGQARVDNNFAINTTHSSNSRIRMDVPENFYAIEIIKAGVSQGGIHLNSNIYTLGFLNSVTQYEITFGSTSRFKITSTGIGIDTTNPQYKLDVIGIGRFFENIYVQSTTTSSSARIGLYQTGSNWWYIENVFPGHLKFTRGAVDYAMFTNMGRLLLGTTSEYTSSILQVNGSITQRSVLGGLIYADANGQLVAAGQAEVMSVLGDSAYIKNQSSIIQTGSFRISGQGRLPTLLLDQSSINSYAELQFRKAGILAFDFYTYTDATNNLYLTRYDDTGAYQGIVFLVHRSSGIMEVSNTLVLKHTNALRFDYAGNQDIHAANNGTIRIINSAYNASNVEFYQDGTTFFRTSIGVAVSALSSSRIRVDVPENYWAFQIIKSGSHFGGIHANGNSMTFELAGAYHYVFNSNSTERMRIATTGNVLIGSNSEAGNYKFQVTGNIYSSTLTGSSVLLKTVSGVITRVEPADMTNLIGDYYIRNQYSSPQGGNAWINGALRADTYIKAGRKGFYGSYDYTEVQGIWAISENYGINTTSNTFGEHYGIAYGYEAGGPLSVDRRPLTNYGHQILFTDNGLVSAAISLTTGGAYFKGNLGIGVSNTHSRLHINGTNPRIWVQDPNATNTPYFYQELIANTSVPYMVMQVGDYAAYRNLSLQNLGGKVIIGATSDYGNYKLQVVGDVLLKDSYLHIDGSAPTIGFRDTDSRGAYIHVNSSFFHILRMNDSGTNWQANSSGLWPLYINLENNNAYFGGYIQQEYTKNTLVYANSVGGLVSATAQNVRDLLGTGSYIQNQFASAQSGNYWIGGSAIVGTSPQNARFVVSGSHSDSTFMLYSVGNGTAIGTSSISMWASEPGLTFDGCGIGANINQSPYNGRREAAQAQSYIRFYAGHIYFSSSTTERTNPSNSPMILSNTERLLVGYGADLNSYKVQVNSGSTTGDGLYVNGNIRATGNIIADGTFSGTSSDQFYKSNFNKVKVYDVIDEINIYSYNHKLYNNKRLIGSIAQELETHFPELISKDNNGYLRVDNYGYAALALQLGKETKSEIEKLKERVKELETKLGL